ncbi:YeeE/YedE thiosulfate transporter family protein [Thalassotalea psychrophila]|uniref:YeeE/YedE thiosulfate transporter family protein n=1 Tax=Thalassotalea psychrophila TaxID=3065647 RepID=A0ABY9TPQ2_9GAMM|nr:YeeE/YedE thiosulfate transporter family protein [Colwelliaceae bacterium SQ149]
MMLLLVAVILVCFIGYLAQTTGLCMVRGVSESMKGNYEFLIAILLSGVLSWVAIVVSNVYGTPIDIPAYSANWWFALGGIVFGLGTALNQGCGVSTLSKLSRGDLTMLITILGWLLGWSILSYWQPTIELIEIFHNERIVTGSLIVLSVVIVIWAMLGDSKRKRLWFSMLGIGLLAGFLFLYERHWTPSGLLHHVSDALLHNNKQSWPSLERYFLFFALIAGMLIAAWHTKKFELKPISMKAFITHLIAGTLMGLGAALAMGGNDSQLLISLPIFSPAGFVAVLGMLVGIRTGLFIHKLMKA